MKTTHTPRSRAQARLAVAMVTIVALAAMALPSLALAQDNPSTAEVQRLLEVTDSIPTARKGFLVGMEQGLSRSASMTAEQRAAVLEIAGQVFTDNQQAFVTAMIPVYQKHYTGEDVRALIAFYSTAQGKRISAATPRVMEEAMLASQSLAEGLVPEIQKRVMASMGQQGPRPAADPPAAEQAPKADRSLDGNNGLPRN